MKFLSRLVRTGLAGLAALLVSAAVQAETVTVRVTTSSGEPVVNAVVSLPGDLPDRPADAPMPEMAQVDVQFDPFVLVVPRGADVRFPNRDRVRHHVYSFARDNAFELELYGREQERSVRFSTSGTVPLGCNIHDQMIAFIRVVDTPHAVRTNAQGEAVLTDVPAGPATLSVWHPYGNAADNVVTTDIVVGEPAETVVTLDILGRR